MGAIAIDPIHRVGCFVALADVAHELSLEIGHRSTNAAGDDVALDFGKLRVDLVKPKTIGRV